MTLLMETRPIQFRRLKSGGYRLASHCIYPTGIQGYAARIEGFVTHTQDGWLIIEPGYQWDGASGPVVDRKSVMRASLIHDALYQLLRTCRWPQELRIEADRLFREVQEQDGAWSALAWIDYVGLRLFASYAARPRPEVEEAIHEAP